ncbi:MAG TPA: hypothetical protein VLF60_04130 [Candidatus Saccharimonadales bacterium]|nr:hypothetical protein [Candidatus Saccharimonadales bacterium]
MGMYVKQQQNNTRLHHRLTHELDKHLNQPKTPLVAAEIAAEKPIVSFRYALAIVLTFGGFVAFLLAMVQHQNPSAVDSPLHARSLAFLGLAGVILGLLTLFVGRHRSQQR